MTSVIPIPNAVVVEPAEPVTDPIPAEPAAEVVVATCARPECTRTFQQGAGRVPELVVLFGLVRNSDVQKSRPLTRSEVLAQELCTTCAHLAVFRTYRTAGTLELMASWAEENAARIEAMLDRRHTTEGAWRQRSLELAIQRQDRGINAILAEGHKERRHHKKLSRRQQREQAALKHRAPKPVEGNKKSKKNKDKQGGKGKGKKK